MATASRRSTMPHRRVTVARAIAAFALAALSLAVPAGATTYPLCGRQIAVDEENGIFKVNGSLVGDWTITAFNTTATSPLLEATAPRSSTGASMCAATAATAAIPRAP